MEHYSFIYFLFVFGRNFRSRRSSEFWFLCFRFPHKKTYSVSDNWLEELLEDFLNVGRHICRDGLHLSFFFFYEIKAVVEREIVQNLLWEFESPLSFLPFVIGFHVVRKTNRRLVILFGYNDIIVDVIADMSFSIFKFFPQTLVNISPIRIYPFNNWVLTINWVFQTLHVGIEKRNVIWLRATPCDMMEGTIQEFVQVIQSFRNLSFSPHFSDIKFQHVVDEPMVEHKYGMST